MTLDTRPDDFARMQDGRTLVIQRWLPDPVDRIWRYLTDSDLRQTWLAAGQMDLTPGAEMELVWRNDGLSAAQDPRPEGFPAEQRMQSRVIAVDPMRRLCFAWGAGDVTFDLEPKGDKVLLTLTHRGLDAAPLGVAAGWHTHLDILSARAGDRAAPSFWSAWTGLRAVYQARLAG